MAIVAIDDRSIAAVGRWPLPRSVLAETVTRLDSAQVAVIGIDLLLPEPEQPSDGNTLSPGDRQLFEALRAGGRAMLSAALTFGPPRPLDGAAERALDAAAFRAVEWPAGARHAGLLEAAGALVPMAPFLDFATLGHTNVPVDRDGALRRLPIAIALSDRLVPALPVELARRFRGLTPSQLGLTIAGSLHLDRHTIVLDNGTRLPLDFYGPAGTVETFALIDLLEGRVPPERLAGRIVLVGTAALGVGDTFVTPYSRALPGVEVLATAVGNVLGNTALRRGPTATGLEFAAILGLGMIAFAAAHLPVPGAAAIGALAALLGWGAAAQLAFETRFLWLDVTFPTLSILLNAGAAATLRAVGERRRRREAERRRRNLSRYHSPVIADLLAEGDSAALREHEQSAAILFVDMADSTRRTERMTPGEAGRFLREFHRRIEAAVLAHGGLLGQFTGDGAMVIFGVPTPRQEDAASALACGRDLLREVAAWSAALAAEDAAPLRIRIGLHFGPVAIATLGGDAQRQLTAAGDTVNVASRLEALMHGRRAAIAISQAAVDAVRAAGRDDLLAGFVRLPDQTIRGREGRVAVWVAERVEAPLRVKAQGG